MPKHLHPNPKIIQKGRSCRVFGKDYISMSEAARDLNLSISWIKEMVNEGKHTETRREDVKVGRPRSKGNIATVT